MSNKSTRKGLVLASWLLVSLLAMPQSGSSENVGGDGWRVWDWISEFFPKVRCTIIVNGVQTEAECD